MTSDPQRRRRPSVGFTTVRVAALSATVAVAIWGALALQLASGDDPALGPKAAAGAAEATPRRIAREPVVGAQAADPATAPATAPPSTTGTSPATTTPTPVQTSTS